MDSEQPTLDRRVADLGIRWEILDTGITVKLYPSCAATHPPLDALIEMKRREGFTPDDVQAIDVEVDSMTPRLLIHPNPATGLEAKFSMPFCARGGRRVSASWYRHVRSEQIRHPLVQALMPRVTLRANEAFDRAAPLSQGGVRSRAAWSQIVAPAIPPPPPPPPPP